MKDKLLLNLLRVCLSPVVCIGMMLAILLECYLFGWNMGMNFISDIIDKWKLEDKENE